MGKQQNLDNGYICFLCEFYFDKLYAGILYNKFFNVLRGKMKFFLCVIGMVMIIEGLPYFAFPDKMKEWIEKVIEMPDDALRRFGMILMFAGLGLVYYSKM